MLNTSVEPKQADKFKDLTLSQKAILLINSVKGFSCTLVGMRQKAYVDDILTSLKVEKIENAEEIFKELKL